LRTVVANIIFIIIIIIVIKYRSLVIERNAEELRDRCDRDVSALCDAVTRLYQRQDRFTDDDSSVPGTCSRDLARFGEICGWYKLILENRRVRSVDVRLRSCWWEVNPFISFR